MGVSLLSCPTEALVAICKYLCRHCIPDHPLNIRHVPLAEKSEYLITLAHLSLTCRQLRDVAQPILYHRPFAIRPTIGLARTLIFENPDLAREVRELEVGTEDKLVPYGTTVLEDDRVRLQAAWDAFGGGAGPVDGLSNKLRYSCLWGNDTPQGHFDPMELELEQLLATLVLEKTKNLAKLTWEVSDMPELPFLPPGSLPQLKEIAMHCPEGLGGGGSLNSIAGVIHAAPSLESLRIDFLAFVNMPEMLNGTFRHENVTSIHLWWASLDSDSFGNLMQSFPSLNTFSYVSGGSTVTDVQEAYPSEIVEALMIRANTLKNVVLDLEDAFYVDGELDDDQVFGTLRSLSKLEKLNISGRGVCEDEDAVPGENAITRILPPSIQVFGLICPNDNLYPAIQQLATVAKEQFSKLRKVILQDVNEQENDNYRKLFEASGIEYPHRDAGHRDFPWEEF